MGDEESGRRGDEEKELRNYLHLLNILIFFEGVLPLLFSALQHPKNFYKQFGRVQLGLHPC
jgi:hypothetical protein